MTPITREMLRAYLTDSLADTDMAAVEKALRADSQVSAMFQEVLQEEDRGEHSLGAVWRRERLSCPTREQLGGYVLKALNPELLDYIEFHLSTIGCAYCQANLEDLQKVNAEPVTPRTARRRKIVDSTAGILKNASGS